MKDKMAMWIAWHLPRRVVKWAAVRLIAYATQGQYGTTIVPGLTALDALQRWSRGTSGGV